MSDVVAKLDDWGLPAWITVMVLGFVIFWPVGLAVLAYLIWSGRMGCGSKRSFRNWGRRMQAGACGNGNNTKRAHFSPSGNRAFDEYREETIQRLESEEREFRDFLERLRLAKDRAEFDEFMKERRNRAANPTEGSSTPSVPGTQNGDPDLSNGGAPQPA